ncbi:hypothetical protein AWC38_SpisGene23036 [Stylophora pistillata]|uniref:Uncharacterized protein n=1 Tax=Stylophora pistillata TaxID=50429 RepID=A0A2B4R9M5_STYPI|nr:hypothetical protein AWC38_SpisGene23036 [Stylophora pistillata]
MDPTENQHATQKQAFLLDTGKFVHAAALNEIKKSQADNGSVFSQKSRPSRRSSVSSGSSCGDTIINGRAKRVALEEKLKFSAAIAEQEKNLEQLKLQEKLGEAQAQEAGYEKALEEEDKEDDSPPLLPTRPYNPINAFLSDDAQELTLKPEADPSVSKNSQLVPTVSAPSMLTSPPKFAVSTSLTSQLTVRAESKTSAAPSSRKLEGTIYFSTHTSSSSGQRAPLTYTTSFTTNSVFSKTHASFSMGTRVSSTYTISSSDCPVHTTTNKKGKSGSNVPSIYATPRGFCGNSPAIIPLPDPVHTVPSQAYLLVFSDTLAKMTQLHRLPQAKPETPSCSLEVGLCLKGCKRKDHILDRLMQSIVYKQRFYLQHRLKLAFLKEGKPGQASKGYDTSQWTTAKVGRSSPRTTLNSSQIKDLVSTSLSDLKRSSDSNAAEQMSDVRPLQEKSNEDQYKANNTVVEAVEDASAAAQRTDLAKTEEALDGGFFVLKKAGNDPFSR